MNNESRPDNLSQKDVFTEDMADLKIHQQNLPTQFGGSGNKFWLFLIKLVIVLIVLCGMAFIPVFLQKSVIYLQYNNSNKVVTPVEKVEKVKSKLEKEIAALDRKLDDKTPKSCFIIINSASNVFTLRKGKEIIKKDVCSTGSYVLLKNDKEQEWMFKTPKGEFKIKGKNTAPVWKKPDWAFIEEGKPVPSANHDSRFEYGVLGDYSLSLGQGYMIHGTLYQRFLGMPVTHGCIRLGDENLELVYKNLSVGSKVYIF